MTCYYSRGMHAKHCETVWNGVGKSSGGGNTSTFSHKIPRKIHFHTSTVGNLVIHDTFPHYHAFTVDNLVNETFLVSPPAAGCRGVKYSD